PASASECPRASSGLQRPSYDFACGLETDRYGSSGADLTVDPHVPTALLDDPVHGGQAESRSLAERLRREKRLERARTRAFVHAAPVVPHDERNVVAGKDVRMLIVQMRNLDRARGQRNRSTVGQSVRGIDDQVDDDLIDLARIDAHVGNPGVEIE